MNERSTCLSLGCGLRGSYRDEVHGPDGRRILERGWRSNTIVAGAWPLLAGLLKGDAAASGLRFWAVGEGEAGWDVTPPLVGSETAGLRQEVDRAALAAEDLTFLAADGTVSSQPTARLEIRFSFRWPGVARTLREFALVAGAGATEDAGTGVLVNYVAHPRIVLPAGATLSRRMRFDLSPEALEAPNTLPAHWLAGERIEAVDGVGQTYASGLRQVGIETLGDLARSEPTAFQVELLPLMKRVELRTKARLALRAAASLAPPAEVLGTEVASALGSTAAELAASTGISESTAARLRERLGELQLSLDQGFLGRLRVGDLSRIPA